MASIYEISTQIQVALDDFYALTDPETGEITDPAAFDALQVQLLALQGAFADKAVAIAAFLDDRGALIRQMKDREEAIYSRRKAEERRCAGLKTVLLRCMQAQGVRKIESPDFRLSLRATPPVAQVDDEKQIPEEYWIVPEPVRKLDRRTLTADMKRGVEVPGAHLGKPGETIVIK